MFGKEINPYPVCDRVTFRNIDKTITVSVKSDPGTLVLGLKSAQAKLQEIKSDSDREQQMEVAKYFAKTVFGDDGDKLADFYQDPVAVIRAVGLYFDKRLKKKITKAQKK